MKYIYYGRYRDSCDEAEALNDGDEFGYEVEMKSGDHSQFSSKAVF